MSELNINPIDTSRDQYFDYGDYINVELTGKIGKVTEGKTAFELDSGVSATEDGELFDDSEDVAF